MHCSAISQDLQKQNRLCEISKDVLACITYAGCCNLGVSFLFFPQGVHSTLTVPCMLIILVFSSSMLHVLHFIPY